VECWRLCLQTPDDAFAVGVLSLVFLMGYEMYKVPPLDCAVRLEIPCDERVDPVRDEYGALPLIFGTVLHRFSLL